MTATLCRSCDAPIRWAKTDAGKNMPLDVEPSIDGNVTLDETHHPARATVHGKEYASSLFALWPRFMPHHATCPHGHLWKNTAR